MQVIVKWAIALFFLAFAAVHGGWEPSPAPAGVPSWWGQQAGSSWLLGTSLNPVAQVLWVLGAAGFLAAGFSLLGWVIPTAWWQALALAASAVSLLLAVLYWHPLQWISALVDAAIIVALLWPNSPVAKLVSGQP